MTTRRGYLRITRVRTSVEAKSEGGVGVFAEDDEQVMMPTTPGGACERQPQDEDRAGADSG